MQLLWCLQFTKRLILFYHFTGVCKKCVLRNFAKFTEKHLRQSLFFNKVTGLRPVTLLKKRLWHRCFSVNFTKFLRTPFLQKTSGRLFLQILVSIVRSRINGLLCVIKNEKWNVCPVSLVILA